MVVKISLLPPQHLDVYTRINDLKIPKIQRSKDKTNLLSSSTSLHEKSASKNGKFVKNINIIKQPLKFRLSKFF